MKVKRSSWHFKVWKWMQGSTRPLPAPTVCGYWSAIFISLPLGCIVIAIAGPFVWVFEKLAKRFKGKVFKGKTFCPFGKIEIE